MGRNKKSKNKEVRSKEEHNTTIEDVGPHSPENSEPAAVVSEWLGTSPTSTRLRNARAGSVRSVFIMYTCVQGIQCCSHGWRLCKTAQGAGETRDLCCLL